MQNLQHADWLRESQIIPNSVESWNWVQELKIKFIACLHVIFTGSWIGFICEGNQKIFLPCSLKKKICAYVFQVVFHG